MRGRDNAHEFAVIGGGIVGAAIADGLARRGKDVAILDEGDVAIRAARGNFGNIWVQGKGVGKPAYADLTRAAAQDWDALASRLEAETGIDLHFRRPGAAFLCFTEEEFERRAEAMARADKGATRENPYQMLDRAALTEKIPAIGPEVFGACWTDMDGTVNPLYLLRALIKSACAAGARHLPRHGVIDLAVEESGFRVATEAGELRAAHVVLAAGLGNAGLAPRLGMFGGVRPVRGQILVTERIAPFLACGTNFIRQTVEGGCLIGESSEEVGLDLGTTIDVLSSTARKAVRAFPHLARARIVRAWGALRIMTRDGAPVYQMRGFGRGEAATATVVSVHSGVTLAPFHTENLAEQIAASALSGELASHFSAERFDVQAH